MPPLKSLSQIWEYEPLAMNNYYQYKRVLMFLACVMFVTLETAIFYIMYSGEFMMLSRFHYYRRGHWAIVGIYVVLMVIFLVAFQGFRVGYLRNYDVLYSQWISFMALNIVTYIELLLIGQMKFMTAIVPVLKMTGVQMAISFAWTICTRFAYARVYPPHQMLLIYDEIDPSKLEEKLTRRGDKYQIKEKIALSCGMAAVQAKMQEYDTVLIGDIPAHERNHLMKYCYWYNIRCYVVPKLSDIMVTAASKIDLFDTPLFLSRNNGINFIQSAVKRLMDLTAGILGTIIASPIMLTIAIAIKAYDGGPVFYRQERVTKDGKLFKIFKFRSMIVESEKTGARLSSADDDRITPVGKIIRRTHFDELPQLFNIIIGDMSLVGPRPERADIMEKYKNTIPEFPFRLKMKAGLTGYAQVYGQYNTTPYDKLKMDLTYIENYSLWLDFKICVFTVKILFQKEKSEGVAAGSTDALGSNHIIKRNDASYYDFRPFLEDGETDSNDKQYKGEGHDDSTGV